MVAELSQLPGVEFDAAVHEAMVLAPGEPVMDLGQDSSVDRFAAPEIFREAAP